MKTGIFITVEGGEGVGKSLFLQNFNKLLEDRNIHAIVTREPGGTPTALRLREIFNAPPEDDPLTPESEVLLVSAARSQHVKHKILPALQKGNWVVSDRYYDSSLVYQGILGKVDSGFLNLVIDKTIYGTHPHLTFLLDCPAEISMARISNRGACENGEQGAARFDDGSIHMHRQIRAGFLSLAEQFPERIKILDASQTPEFVLNQAQTEMERLEYW